MRREKLWQHGESKSRELLLKFAATSLRFGVGGFQVADQALEGFLIRVVVLPVAEVGDDRSMSVIACGFIK
jgi:hypothetical protein